MNASVYTLIVLWSPGAQVTFVGLSQSEKPYVGWSDAIEVSDRMHRLRDVVDKLVRVRSSNAEVNRAVAMGIRAPAKNAYMSLPHEIRKWMDGVPHGSLLRIYADVDRIPWEMLFDGGAYLGEKYLIIRYSSRRRVARGQTGALTERAAASSEKAETNGPFARVLFGRSSSEWPTTLLHVVGRDLPKDTYAANVNRFAAMFEQARYIRSVPEELLCEMLSADLIYIKCHGFRDSAFLATGRDFFYDLQIDLIESDEGGLKTGSLVFVNACYSALAPTDAFTDYGLAVVCLAKGASEFIGTNASVPQYVAQIFADEFFACFCEDDGFDTVRAYLHARDVAPLSAKLIYTLYHDGPDRNVLATMNGVGLKVEGPS